MIDPITLLIAVSAAAGIGSFVVPSRIARDLARLAPASDLAQPHRWSPVSAMLLERSGSSWSVRRTLAIKLTCSLCAAALALPLAPILAPVLAYVGFVVPTAFLERRASGRLRRAEEASVTLLEWFEALVAAGRPAETALVAIATRGTRSPLLDSALSRASASYALGAPLFRALAMETRAVGLSALTALAESLERSRDLGRGSLAVIRDTRDALRAAERARSLDLASAVEAKLMLVLVLCYLPALMLAVVVPLFLSLLQGLSL